MRFWGLTLPRDSARLIFDLLCTLGHLPSTPANARTNTLFAPTQHERIINKQTFEGTSLLLIALQHKALARALVFGEKHRLLSPRSHSHRESIRLDEIRLEIVPLWKARRYFECNRDLKLSRKVSGEFGSFFMAAV